MKRVARWFIRLYPEAWRARYEEEFAGLIEDAPPRWSSLFDLLKGAFRMQIRIFNFPRLALPLSIVGVLTGLGVSFLVTPRYTSLATLEFVKLPDSSFGVHDDSAAERLMLMQAEVLSRTSLSAIIQDPRLDLYPQQRLSVPLEDVIDDMRRDIRVSPENQGYVSFQVAFTYSDRLKARETVQALVSRFFNWSIEHESRRSDEAETGTRQQIERLESRVALLEQRLGIGRSESKASEAVLPEGISLVALDRPSLPVRPVYPNRYHFMAVGFGAGIVLALVITMLRRRPQPAAPLTSTS